MPPHFIQVSVPSPESERTYICVRGSILPLSMIFHLDFDSKICIPFYTNYFPYNGQMVSGEKYDTVETLPQSK
jgi:hypothetical protein